MDSAEFLISEENELLAALGATCYDTEVHSKKLIENVENILNPKIVEIKEESDLGKLDESIEKSCEELIEDKTQDHVSSHKINPNESSILQGLLTNNNKVEETENERRIRMGEMTPFGNVLANDDSLSQKSDEFMKISSYLSTQTALQEAFQKRKINTKRKTAAASKRKKSQNYSNSSNTDSSEDSDAISLDAIKAKQLKKLELNSDKKQQKASKLTSKNDINTKLLFPSHKIKKNNLATLTSNNKSDKRKKSGNLLSEQTSIYTNPADDSDYIPPDQSNNDDSDWDHSRDIQKKLRSRKEKSKIQKKISKETDDSSSDYSSDQKSKSRSTGKIYAADDGDVKRYKERVRRWKESETRFTNEVQTLQGGFKLPKHIWDGLYNYQKVGVKWLWELHTQRSGGILSDEMGLGKTVQMITFLAGVSCANILFRFSEHRGVGPSLIVCPATVMRQWVQEFHKWWPPFRVALLHESGCYSGKKDSFIQSMYESKGILITTYTGLVINQDELLKYNWDYVILDEGHKIRNPDAQVTISLKRFRTPHRIILSGSPLQNNLKELWSLFDFVMPGKLATLPVFIEQFSIPITQGGYSNATDIQVAAAFKCATTLRDIINPFLLRRMKSDVSTHITLPPKNEQVLFCKLTDEQREVYQNYLKSDHIRGVINSHFNVFAGLINLRKICNHPHLFDAGSFKIIKPNNTPKNKSSGRKNYEILEEDEDSDIDINKESNNEFGHWSKSGKMIVLRTLLKLWKKQDHKVLLFTQSRQMLYVLEKFIRQESYTYLKLDGGTSIGSRQKIIDSFNRDSSIFIFILTTRVGGLGTNLTGADRVIVFDPDWNPSIDLQARERAWRIGQERQVTIYRLITSGTIEEKIYHRQIFKQFLTNRVLKDPKQKRFFKSNDLLELFTLTDKSSEGTETEAIFAGTDSAVAVPRRSRAKKSKRSEAKDSTVTKEDEIADPNPVERDSGKFKGVPYLVKQRPFKQSEKEELEEEKYKGNLSQDEYVLRKLFRKSGVEAALKHDKIMDTRDPDYLIVEKEAERIAKEAVRALKKSREQCWDPTSGKVTWTGSSGSIRQNKPSHSKHRPSASATLSSLQKSSKGGSVVEEESEIFLNESNSKAIVNDEESSSAPMSSTDLMAIILKNQQKLNLIPSANEEAEGDDTNSIVATQHMELLQDIRSFIAFRAHVDGQASTNELVEEFGKILPSEDSPLFKQMLNQLCSSRKVDGVMIWRLKPEFR